MGFAITWCAVREDEAEAVLRELGLSPTGEVEEVPESLIATASIDTGWRVIWYNAYECPFLKRADLARLSMRRELLLCQVEEHVLVSAVEYWNEGERTWWIRHDGGASFTDLDADGDLPDCFTEVRDANLTIQRGSGEVIDYVFDIPMDVAKLLVGFKHDDDGQGDAEVEVIYTVLTRQDPNAPAKKGFFAWLFGS